jgi:hypothetical protein
MYVVLYSSASRAAWLRGFQLTRFWAWLMAGGAGGGEIGW